MSTHTPGPWTTDEADHDMPHQDIRIKASKHHTVCTVWIDDAPVRDFNAEQTANARLLAAAPDMLEALQGLLNRPGPIYNLVEDERHWPQIAEARAAIAKATENDLCPFSGPRIRGYA